MPGKNSLSDQIIAECLKKDYGIEVISLAFLSIGADIHAFLFKAQAFDQKTYFVKIKRGYQYDVSAEIVEILYLAGIKEVIPPIKTVQGKGMVSLNDFTLIVYPFVVGQNGFNKSLKEEQWIKLGNALKQVHEIALPKSIQTKIRKETYSDKWRKVVGSIYSHIEANSPHDEIALKLGSFMKVNRVAIQRLVKRAEELGKKLQNTILPFVLCHSDIHGGNVLLDDHSHIYIVDWDDPIMAPKERDLMFIGGGVGNVWNKPMQERFFYKGYREVKIDRAASSYYRHERIVEDIAIYSQELLLKANTEKDRLEMLKHFLAMFDPEGVVDIAFRTDEAL